MGHGSAAGADSPSEWALDSIIPSESPYGEGRLTNNRDVLIELPTRQRSFKTGVAAGGYRRRCCTANAGRTTSAWGNAVAGCAASGDGGGADLSDHRSIIGAGDGDGDGLGVAAAIAVGNGDGEGFGEGFTNSEILNKTSNTVSAVREGVSPSAVGAID